ncbi:sulfate ABC transporter ATP-binding protein [Rhodobacterales bacterium 52_120_T64]|nr:sulfate ABC transporter ATP-binding protein [Rhodobacterales bacterium 52_120_T64]
MVILPLKMVGATAYVRGKRLVGPVDLTLAPEGFTIVIGPNGAGKTTLLRLMHGLQRLSGGSIDWAVSLTEARRKQAYVFQSPIMMRRRVVDCIAYPLLLRGENKKSARAKAKTYAERYGLGHVLQNWAPDLSGGEKQKLSLARALITEPEILFLDEPCANLDGRATREIEAILQKVQDEGNRIVMSTHDLGQARRLAKDVIFMLNGKIHESGEAEEFFSAPQTLEAQAFTNGEIVE